MVHVYGPVEDLYNSTLIFCCNLFVITSAKFDLQPSVKTKTVLLIMVCAHVVHEHTLVTYFSLMSVTSH